MPTQFTTEQALALCQAVDYPRFSEYTISAIRSMLGNKVKRVGTKVTGVDKPKAVLNLNVIEKKLYSELFLFMISRSFYTY